ncbi:MAG TPA: hypothetical protein VGV90_10775 [Solirubrobacteraceae bacterium]|nr:hypothetical protein [Solirubrobacteraceae bacterium]
MHRTCAAMLGAAALAIAGCGGGEDDRSEPGTEPLTKAPFIARADAICREVKQAQRPHTQRIQTVSRGADALRKVAPLLEAALAEARKGRQRLQTLRAQAPREDRATLDAYFAAADRLLAAAARLAQAARADDRAAGRRLADTADALSADEQRLAGEYGLEDCGDVF